MAMIAQTLEFTEGLPILELLGGTLSLTATGEGMYKHARWRRPRLIRWEDVHLFEVRQHGSDPPYSHTSPIYTYRLYSFRTTIIWQSSPRPSPGILRPDGIVHEEMVARHRALRSLTILRTGLQPRTFDYALRSGPVEPSSNTWWVAGCVAGLVIAVLAFVVSALGIVNFIGR
jgi:hypothetical protein